MKTLENLKAFSLCKEQMNEVAGGQTICDDMIVYVNKYSMQMTAEQLDKWADLYEINCK